MLCRVISATLLATGFLFPQAQPSSANLYRDEIKPILVKNCLACHNSSLKQSGLDLSTREALLRGSEHGPVVVAGNPNASQLYKAVAHIAEPHMPFKARKLPEQSISKIAEWIKAGFPYGDVQDDPDLLLSQEAQKHWAFRVPQRPTVPTVKDASWSSNPIDAFISAQHEARKLTPLPQADKRTLIRRVYLDLAGVPPSPDDIRTFLNDKRPDAWERVVDKLLASTQYGERWGRHWLDVWRYSDWYGWRQQNQVRYSQRHIWRWRDWTVEALNSNKPYDRMIVEMLAGDEAEPGNPEVTRATGYLGRNWYMFNRNVWLQDTVDYTSAAFLGLTLKCARCHTHKYDPIPHQDYYKMRAFFEPHDVRTDRVKGEADAMKAGVARVYDADASRPTYRFLRGNESTPDTSTALEPAIPVLFGKVDLKITPVALPPEAYFPDGRSFVPDDLRAQAKAEVEKAEAALAKVMAKPEAPAVVAAAEKKLEAVKAAIPALEARLAAEQATTLTPVPSNIEELAEKARKLELEANFLLAQSQVTLAQYELEQAQGSEKKVGAARSKLEAGLKALKEPAEGYTPIGPRYPTTSTGRRLALARWIGSKQNPLTARVAINHMWMRHFGKPLVSTVFNFGRSGKAPTHPELLDWLATEFMERSWDMKAMHRLMVTSNAYKLQSSGWSADAPEAKIDPDNASLWRMNVRRLEAEAVRDSVLAVAGKLDSTMGGPEIEETRGNDIHRRSLYFRHSADLQMDMLKVFDVASPNECFQRSESIVPQQALALANGTLSLSMARELARQLSLAVVASAPLPPSRGNRAAVRAATQSDQSFVEHAFERVLGRLPKADELQASLQYLQDQASLYRSKQSLSSFSSGPQSLIKPSDDPSQRARESLVHVLLNHNDFVSVR